ncbi:MAG: ribonuclease III [Lachnospiraceae bacterium]|nr:ribonuclease III [Lachnospiraceae bacterium]
MEESLNKDYSFLNEIKSRFCLKEVDIRTYSPLTLAFIGDCFFEIIVRTIFVGKGNKSVNALAKDKNLIVNAKTQSMIADFLLDHFNDEEKEIYRKGKNTKTQNHSKSAAYSEYHKATGLEAVYGYLYLTNQYDRALTLLKLASDAKIIEI